MSKQKPHAFNTQFDRETRTRPPASNGLVDGTTCPEEAVEADAPCMHELMDHTKDEVAAATRTCMIGQYKVCGVLDHVCLLKHHLYMTLQNLSKKDTNRKGRADH